MPGMMKRCKNFWKLQQSKGKYFKCFFKKLPKGRKVKKALAKVIENNCSEYKMISNSEFDVWYKGNLNDFIDKIGDILEEKVYKSDFDFELRRDRVDIFPI